SAWKFDPKTGQWYYHYFYPEQPDLNWRNPAVEKAMFDVTRWWYQRGVSGFRLDAVDTLFEDPDLRDNPILPGTNKYGDPNMQDKYNTKLPELHDVLRDLRKVADEHSAVLIGETWTKDFDEENEMENNDPKRKEDVRDPIGKIGWPKEKGRDGERTPMQWNDSTNAGFSQAIPWLPVPPSYKTHNVASELKDPDSILQFYRR